MMGSDELIEGQNLTRRLNLQHGPVPLPNIAPPRHAIQKKLVDFWGASAIRVTRSSAKRVKKQAKLTRWIPTATVATTNDVHASD